MPSVTNTISIHRSPDDVFAFVADGTTAPRWRSGVLDIAHVSGTGVGERYRQGMKGHRGLRVAADYEITAFEPGRRLTFKTITGVVRPTGEFRFEQVEDGTRLTFSLTAELGFVQRLLLGGFVQRSMDAEGDSIERLRQLLEA